MVIQNSDKKRNLNAKRSMEMVSWKKSLNIEQIKPKLKRVKFLIKLMKIVIWYCCSK